jgi:predicted short-subunit dehydrogenase-like oxidoreductase (DUF2520 family)
MSVNNYLKNGIVIIGAGNVASHLSFALKKHNFLIRCVYSRSIYSAKQLGEDLGVDFTTEFDSIPKNADLYIIAVKDDALVEVIRNFTLGNATIVHTAGSISMDIFQGLYKEYGVLYPLQTFSKSRDLDFNEIPICIEASNKLLENKLFELSSCLSKDVKIVSSEKRKKMHLAAVFVCNFVNHMYVAATELLADEDISFEILKPLINETARKAIESDPYMAQTGPAVRDDQNILQKHIEMLKEYPEFQKIYRFVSDSIYKLNQKKNKN